MDSAPLPIEVGAALDAMVAQAYKLNPSGVHGLRDILEGYFGIVREMGMAMADSPELAPTGVVADGDPFRP